MLSLYELDYGTTKLRLNPVKNQEEWFTEHIDQIRTDDIARFLAVSIEHEELYFKHAREMEDAERIWDMERKRFNSSTKFNTPPLKPAQSKKNAQPTKSEKYFKAIKDPVEAAEEDPYAPYTEDEFTLDLEVVQNEFSEGAKAALNVLSFPNVVFDLSDCSIIAITLALTIPDGKIALTRYEKESTHGYPYRKYDFRNRIRVVTEYGTQFCKSVFQAYRYFTWSLAQKAYNRTIEWSMERCLNRHALSTTKMPFGINTVTFEEFISAAVWRYEEPFDMRSCSEFYTFEKPRYPGYSDGQGYTAWNDLYDDISDQVYERYERSQEHEFTSLKILRKKYLYEVTRRDRAQAGFNSVAQANIKKDIASRQYTTDIIQWLYKAVYQETKKSNSEEAGTTYIQIGLANAYMRGYYDLETNSNIEIVFKLNHEAIEEQTKVIAKELEEGKARESWKVRAYYKSKEEQAREIIRDVYLLFLGKIMENLQRDFKKTVSIKEIKEKGKQTMPTPTGEMLDEKSIENILIAEEAKRSAAKKEKKALSQIEEKRERKRERELQRKVRESEMEKGIIWI